MDILEQNAVWNSKDDQLQGCTLENSPRPWEIYGIFPAIHVTVWWQGYLQYLLIGYIPLYDLPIIVPYVIVPTVDLPRD